MKCSMCHVIDVDLTLPDGFWLPPSWEEAMEFVRMPGRTVQLTIKSTGTNELSPPKAREGHLNIFVPVCGDCESFIESRISHLKPARSQ